MLLQVCRLKHRPPFPTVARPSSLLTLQARMEIPGSETKRKLIYFPLSLRFRFSVFHYSPANKESVCPQEKE